MNKKPRSDAKLLSLPEPQAALLRDFLFEGGSCAEAVEFAQANFDLATSTSAVSHFWRRTCGPLLAERRLQSLQTARALADSGRDSVAPLQDASQTLLQQRLFDLSLTPKLTASEINALAAALNKSRSLALAESRLALARARAGIEERRLACREENSAQTRRAKQAATDREDESKRNWNNMLATIFRSPAPGKPSSAPQSSATDLDSSPDANPASGPPAPFILR